MADTIITRSTPRKRITPNQQTISLGELLKKADVNHDKKVDAQELLRALDGALSHDQKAKYVADCHYPIAEFDFAYPEVRELASTLKNSAFFAVHGNPKIKEITVPDVPSICRKLTEISI